MTTDAKEDIKIFRAALFPLFVAIAGPALVIICAIMLHHGNGRPVDWKAFALGTLAIVIMGAAFAWVISVGFPVKLSPAGVKGHSFWGRPSFIAWPDISRATPFRYLTFKFLRLHAANGSPPTWIALSQGRPNEFENEIHILAPPNCPVRAHLK